MKGLKPATISAFSLIEIVAAIGIVSFALVGIASLFSVLLHNERSAIIHSQLPRMTSSLIHQLKVSQAAGGAPVEEISRYFDEEGSPLPGETGATYVCKAVVKEPEPIDSERDPGPYTSLVVIEVRNWQSKQLLETAHATLRYE